MKLGTEGTKPEGSGGRYVDAAGNYHFVINDVKHDDGGGYPKLAYECEVVGGEHDEQAGKIVSYDLFLPEGSQYPEDNASALLRFACALGVYSKEQWAKDRDGGIEADVPLDEAAGLQFVGKVELKPDKNDKDKKWARITRVYAVGDDESQGVPMSAEHLSIFGGKLPMSAGGFRQGGGSAAGGVRPTAIQPASQSPQATQAAAAGNDDDLF